MRIPKMVVLFILMAGSVQAQAVDCDNHVDAYESGVEAGRADAERNKSADPSRHKETDRKHKKRYACYEKGYGVGYLNAAADARRQTASHHSRNSRDYEDDAIPRAGSNERAYFDDGCSRGREDGRAGMSSYYGRYSDEYDSRFEPYFARGYEMCWRENR